MTKLLSAKTRGLLFSRLPRLVQEQVILNKAAIGPHDLEGVTVSVATSVDDYLEAGQVLHRGYLDEGLIEPQPGGLHLAPQLLRPTTTLFVARKAGRVMGTLSLALDSHHGLPMDVVYPRELSQLRAQGRRLAEVGTLCVSSGHRRRGVSFLLYKLMWRCARELLDVDDLLAGVWFDAAPVYETIFRFVPMEPRSWWPGVKQGGVGLRLDLRTAEAVMRRAFGHLPKDERNPHHLYVGQNHPQLQLPTREQLQQAAAQSLRVAAQLTRRLELTAPTSTRVAAGGAR